MVVVVQCAVQANNYGSRGGASPRPLAFQSQGPGFIWSSSALSPSHPELPEASLESIYPERSEPRPNVKDFALLGGCCVGKGENLLFESNV
jgi:hypothetical protein